jgi:SNF2 family DNA or RNA helicase
MPPRLTLIGSALRLFSASEPPLHTGVVTYRKGKGSAPLCVDIAGRLVHHYGESLQISQDALLALQLQRSMLRTRVEFQQHPPEDWPAFHSDLWPHQRQAAGWLRDVKRGILCDEQGMGKTVSALIAAKEESLGVIVCSNIKKQDWLEHYEKWISYDPFAIRVLDGDADSRALVLQHWHATGGWLIVNYDQVVAHEADLRSVNAWIFDEVHKIRNRKSQWWKVAHRLTKHAEYVLALTATSTINTASEIWSLLALVDPARFKSFWSFVYRFFETSTNGFGIQIGDPKDPAALEELVRPYMLTRTREEVGGLGVPPVIRRTVRFDMSPTQRALYDQIEQEDHAEYQGDEVDVWLPIQKITRLRQLAIDPHLVFPAYNGPSKLDCLVDIVREEVDRPTLVFFMFEQAAQRATDMLLFDTGAHVLSGSMSDRDRRESLDAFRSGECKVLCCTHGTGGEGLNLPTASRVIYVELAWHAAGNKQAMDRAVRPGQQADSVEVIVIRTADSIEDHIWDIVAQKQRVTIDKLMQRIGR